MFAVYVFSIICFTVFANKKRLAKKFDKFYRNTNIIVIRTLITKKRRVVILVQLQASETLDYAKRYDILLEKERSYLKDPSIENKKYAIIGKLFADDYIVQKDWIKTVVHIVEAESDEDILKVIARKVHLMIDGLFAENYIVQQDWARIILYTIETAPDESILQDIIEKVSLLNFDLFKYLYRNLTLNKNSNFKNGSQKDLISGVLLRHSITLSLDTDDYNEISLLSKKLSFILNVEPCPLVLISAIGKIKILQIKQDASLEEIDWQRIKEVLSFSTLNNNCELMNAITELLKNDF